MFFGIFSLAKMGMIGLTCYKLSLSQPTVLIYWSLVRRSQYSYIYKHSKTLELTEKHDKHFLQFTANCN